MSPIEALVEKLTPDQRELLARLLGASRSSAERESIAPAPIAIVGMSCRFPGGADSPEAFWKLLLEGRDAISEVPPHRFRIEDFYDPTPATPGKMSSKWGGFLEDVEGFDTRFFGISPREAADMDPQQRLLLEVAQEALEDAGLVARDLAASATGVFVGTHSHDYSWLQFRDPRRVRAYASTGTANSIVANRLSYLLDLRGPSLAVDTACSSSLVALHLACRSLASGDCRVALAAGVNVILSPHWGVAVSQLGMLSPDGRCRAFDAAANGFVRSEGVAVVALKRLPDALADGDRIHAVVRGSFVNQDGRTNGITAPNGLSQQAVVRAALADARVVPDAISYVETHGTGTALGDPIEVEALAAVLGGRKGDAACVLGSVKSNVGHLEAAAGMAGLFKVVLALEKESIPPQIHFERLNPHISLSGTRFVIPREPVAWPRSEERPRLSGVSSFGFGGTNAHVVIEQAPAPAEPPSAWPEEKSHLLVLSARTDDALQESAERYARWLRSPSSAPVQDVCYTASLRRNHYERRLAVVGVDAGELAHRLESHAAGRSTDGLAAGGARGRATSSADEPKPVFVFAGQGPQWWAMGRELSRCEPVFLRTLERCDEILSRRAKWSLLEELRASEESSRVAATEIAQPALFALQVGLSALLASWGVEPSALVGHSLGEIAAAHVAGALDLEQALEVVFERGRLMEAASGKGSMVSIESSLEEVEARLAPFAGALVVAASNGPRTTVVSGGTEATDELLASLERDSIPSRRLPVGYAFHSPRMEPAARELASALSGLAPRRSRLPLVSTVTGRWADGSDLVASHWRNNVRERVRFHEAISLLLASGRRLFVEIGPHPVLSAAIHGALDALGIEGSVLPTLRRGRGESSSLLEALGALHVAGTKVDFTGVFGSRRPVVSLPQYPFQRERFPLPNPTTMAASRLAAGEEADAHPLLGRRLSSPIPMFEARVDASASSLLAEHRRDGRALFPAAGYLSMALAAASRISEVNESSGAPVVEDLAILRPLLLPDEGEGTLQWVGEEATSGRTDFRVFFSTPGEANGWTLTASGTLFRAAHESPRTLDVQALQGELSPLSTEEHYRRAGERGIEFGPRFRSVREIYRGGGQVLASIEAVPEVEAELSLYGDHPALVDAWLQPIQYALPDEAPLYLPIACERFVRYRALGTSGWSYARLREASNGIDREAVTFDVVVVDEAGTPVAELEGLRMKRAAERSGDVVEPSLSQIEWRELDAGRMGTANEEDVEWILVGGETALTRALEAALRSRSRSLRRPSPEKLSEVVAATGSSRLGVVHLEALADGDGDVVERQRRLFEPVLDLLRAKPGVETRLWLVTRGAQRIGRDDEPMCLASSTLHGLAPTLALEQPELRPVTVDLDPLPGEREGNALASLLRFDLDESRLALRGGRFLAARLVPMAGEDRAVSTYRLVQGSPGVVDELRVESFEPSHPGPGEVAVEVECTGLNFRDVLAALDLYPGRVGPPGNECAGRVTAIGEGVEGWSVGDRAVVALVPGCFASQVKAPAERVVALPPSLSFREGASSPIAFLTARYGLERRARLREGERVLVHAAAGGVGMAAIQIARHAGAEIYATAGTEAKRERLRSMGVRHVFDSRRLDFVEEVLASTKREGVDVVLNSLSGEFIEASLSLLRPGGRFVEIGKRGIWTGSEVAAVRKDVSYVVFDLEDVYRRDPKAMRAMLVETLRDLDEGRLEPLPARAFPMKEAASAFRYMAEARHMGKVVVDRVESEEALPIDPEARYLVTGGLGAVGLQVARWLAGKGARHLVLGGRSAPSAEAESVLGALRDAGVDITVAAADVEREHDVRRLVAAGDAARPLKGIVHAAGVLRDGILSRQSFEDLEVVLGPKVRGGWNLHRATLETPLDFFVLLSSMASVIGSSGQGGYSAANAFLDALAHERRRLGLPATSVSFGPFAETGMASRDAGPERYHSRGIRKMTTGEGLTLLERLLSSGAPPHALALAVDWASFARSLPSGRSRALVSELARRGESSVPAPTSSKSDGFVERLRRAPSSKRRAMVTERVRVHVLSVLGLPEDSAFDPKEGLRDAGLDSLMAVEVRNRLRSDVPSLSLPTTLCFDFPTVDAVAGFLMKGLELDGRNGDEVLPGPGEAAKLDDLRELSEEEAEALLLQELEGRQS